MTPEQLDENKRNTLNKEIWKKTNELFDALKRYGVLQISIDSVRKLLKNCMDIADQRQSNNSLPGNSNGYMIENINQHNKIPPEIENYCTKFKEHIQGIEKIDEMINKVKELIKSGKLKITSDEMGKHILLDDLGYEIYCLDSNNYKKEGNKIHVTRRSNKTDFTGEKYETNLQGLKDISSYYRIVTGLKAPDEREIKEILERLHTLFPEIIINTNRNGNYHDEDIAFFMLLTQNYGEILLNDDGVLKCYDTYRGIRRFQNNRDRKDGTGQIILVRKI